MLKRELNVNLIAGYKDWNWFGIQTRCCKCRKYWMKTKSLKWCVELIFDRNIVMFILKLKSLIKYLRTEGVKSRTSKITQMNIKYKMNPGFQNLLVHCWKLKWIFDSICCNLKNVVLLNICFVWMKIGTPHSLWHLQILRLQTPFCQSKNLMTNGFLLFSSRIQRYIRFKNVKILNWFIIFSVHNLNMMQRWTNSVQ